MQGEILKENGNNNKGRAGIMTPEEMQEKVCGPQLKRIEDLAQKTHKALCESNGKPSVLSRLDAVEVAQQEPEKNTFTKFGIRFEQIESRDLPRILGAIALIILVLEKFGMLGPIMKVMGK